jgi:hypothetical protein
VVGVVGGSHELVAGGVVDVGFGYAAEVDWHCIDGVVVQMEALASVPAGEGSRWCIGSLRALLAPCLYAAFWL